MDLVLLQPGDTSIVGNNSWDTGGSLISKDPWGSTALDEGLSSFGFNPENCIELVSIHQGMKQQMTTDVSNSARTSGRPIITEFTCVKYVDQSSVKLYDLCLRAKPMDTDKAKPTSLFVLRNSGENMVNIISMQLRLAMVSEIQFQTNPDDMPTEQFKLSFTEVLWKYTVQLANTSPAGVIPAGWSLARNRPISAFTD
ncbi:type VI secretion system tube protein Hcp [Gallaecimonas pentaromativorans]|uniref:Type VI secretion system secreted protein Hcp n=1 Tax=Gallaecimonas pentaromativorans TaxID=584787 RepID=A0A3N1PPW9_9GAMM|nr:type VI secretion system tube protein Hcp [Gallaecimonas pentaromativorans]MED5523360.1 type VI secretion system tube protein Hcp [Pseudomonadota bacterium]ROQ30553.1 type VI secretion system secreted protein Hcp [Gallaecimonas pentaromativorans]